MNYKVLVTPRSFGKTNPTPIEVLKEKGYEVIMNPYGRIMTEEEMISEIEDVDGIIIGVDPLNRNVLKHAKKLKAISKYGVGTDNIDMEYTKNAGIPVTRTVGANSDAVADYAMALLLGVARKVVLIDKECRKLNWNKITTVEMWGKTLGLIGLGSIGKGVAKRASGFNMKILAYDLYQDEEYAKANNIEYVSLEKLLKESDFISLHLPLTKDTKNLISYKEFEMMKDKAVIVNTARGGIIDEEALLWALKENKIWGAGIDVFEEEPPKNQELLKLDNIIIGSHCAASTYEAIDNMGMMAAQNLIQCLEDKNTKEF
jgi:D-3-phosphoglycerate dehydrogenase